MSIKAKDNSLEIQCDSCGRKPEFYFGDWQAAWSRAKADGWRASKDETGAWCHTCPTCAESGQ